MEDKNINEQILDELRKQSRTHRQGVILSIIFLAAALLYIVVFPCNFGKVQPKKTQNESSWTWTRVENLVDKGNYDEAEKIALNLSQKTPADYYPQACLARLYLRKGDLTKAVQHAELAYRLFPDKYNNETLQALKKRLAGENALKAKSERGQ